MSAGDWLRNTRGEWYVIGQGVLTLAVVAAPLLDGTTPAPGAWSLTQQVGVSLCVLGLLVVAGGTLSLGRSLSPFPRPRESGRLVERGAFALVRHPIYSGFGVSAFGWGLAWMSAAAIVAAVALAVFFDVKARREELWLSARFPEYAAYKARVRRLVPFIY